MKRTLTTTLAAIMALTVAGCQSNSTGPSVSGNANTENTAQQLIVVPEEERPRAIITTDVECDDMNSLIHLSLYFNEVDVDGIVYSASKYHFNGDGKSTLGEVTPNYLCEGEAVWKTKTGAAQPDPEAVSLTHYRDIPEGWIENLWNNEYAEAYEHLSKNDANYPTPEYLTSITKYGNIAFEGDVREDTEGSNLIKEAILDDDPRKLYIFSWGGVNTVVRALLSIEEEYGKTDEWESIQKKVIDKIIISGNGQDNSWADQKIEEKYPGIVQMSVSNYYGVYFAPLCKTDDHDPKDFTYLLGTSPDVNYTFQSDWLLENIEENHGSLMTKYNLMGDGTHFENEPDAYQYGENPTIDWGYELYPAKTFDKYDFLAEGDSAGFMALLNNGLGGMKNGSYGSWSGIITYSNEEKEVSSATDYLTGTAGSASRFQLAYQLDWAARADWCVKDYDEANHAPIVTVETQQLEGAAGKPVTFSANVSDPDGDQVNTTWWYYQEGSNYSGKLTDLRVWNQQNTSTGFTIPADAKPGDVFNIVIEATDNSEIAPMTRYSQVIITVK